MQKLFRLLPVFLAAALCTVSCLNEKEGSYSFNKVFYSDADSLRAEKIVSHIKLNPYFSTPSTYTGTFSDAYTKAQVEFILELDTINDTLITNILEGEEYAALSLESDNTKEILAYKYWQAESED